MHQNALAPGNAHLHYPPGFAMVAQAPVLKQDLLSLNGESQVASVNLI